MGYDSVTTWRLYSAEHSVGLGLPLDTIADARALVRRIKASSWWKQNVAYQVAVRTDPGGFEDTVAGPAGEAIRTVASFAAPYERGLGARTTWKISLHPTMLADMVVFHEVAHTIAPRYTYGGTWDPDYLPPHRPMQGHGEGFAGIMSEIVAEFGTGDAHDDLRSAYDHFEVPTLTLPEYKDAVSGSIKAEVDLVRMYADLDERSAALETARAAASKPAGVIPRITWGDMFRGWRGRFAPPGKWRLSQRELAEAVSVVEPCTRHDIARIESSEVLPASPRLRRIAMCTVVHFDIDPIWARFTMGLARWDCNVELDELSELNPSWVELVTRMNRQLEERPPRWSVDGSY
ncbi:hypothetical protein [Nocardioides sp.]|uniref:hypothetical protein n=1 Tax=Nocardioides sp. TaxID=35761 RepID=UPI00321C22E0